MNTWKLMPFVALCCLAGISVSSQAADGGTTTLTITGNIVEPDCVINNNQQIVVDFKEVMTTRIDGVSYKREQINYTLTCDNLIRNTLRITLKGTAGYNAGLFNTDVTGLGIRVTNASGTAIAPNGTVDFTYVDGGTPPVLYAIPVAQNAATLPNVDFNGSATMVFSYL
ncbi:fimbrial protein [Entomohabitans teleogrylli]|uniref:fimbrial protein n=1 Tax=Entomohabitans teleogrylli TaxID=1384589 RepID=UPI000A6B2E6B|nr:fimbrial protein [Entomohabitans teleogrylli]